MRDCTENQIIITFIRHAKIQSNLEKRYCGSATDEDLCAEGIKNANEKKELFAFPKPDFLFCGPKKRCISTAGILYPDLKPEIIPGFDEIDFGDFNGKNHEELSSNPDYQKWMESNGELPFPNGESREDFIKRTMSGFWKMIALVSSEKEEIHVTVIAHGGSIMAILSSLTDGGYFDYQVGNLNGYRISFSGTKEHYITEIKERF